MEGLIRDLKNSKSTFLHEFSGDQIINIASVLSSDWKALATILKDYHNSDIMAMSETSSTNSNRILGILMEIRERPKEFHKDILIKAIEEIMKSKNVNSPKDEPIVSNPPDSTRLANLLHQANRIRSELNKIHVKNELISQIRFAEFLTVVLKHKPSILHFSGHGTSSKIIFTDFANTAAMSDIPINNFINLFKKISSVKCAIFACCKSADWIEKLTEYIDIVIGIDGDMTESAAPAFSEAFYNTAVENPVEIAFFNAHQTYLHEAGKELEKWKQANPGKEPTTEIKEPVMFCKRGIDPNDVFLYKM